LDRGGPARVFTDGRGPRLPPARAHIRPIRPNSSDSVCLLMFHGRLYRPRSGIDTDASLAAGSLSEPRAERRSDDAAWGTARPQVSERRAEHEEEDPPRGICEANSPRRT